MHNEYGFDDTSSDTNLSVVGSAAPNSAAGPGGRSGTRQLPSAARPRISPGAGRIRDPAIGYRTADARIESEATPPPPPSTR
ncbi:MAG: hypothetical protein AB9897_03970 [Anaerolineaceae bacterium]